MSDLVGNPDDRFSRVAAHIQPSCIPFMAQRVLEPPHCSVQMEALFSQEAILKKWAEHFNSVLNRPSSINEDAIYRLPQIECNVLFNEFPTVMETRKAIQPLPPGKAPGADAIPAEVYKAGGYPWQRN